MKTRLEALCDALRERGAHVIIESRTSLRVRGSGIQAIADEIRYFKPELLRGLWGARGAAPYACARCGVEVVLAPDQECIWCASLRTRPIEIRPNSIAETAFLARVIHNEKASQLSQAPNWDGFGIAGKIHPSAHHAAA